MKKKTLKVIADLNGRNYQSEVVNYIKSEEKEQIASCILGKCLMKMDLQMFSQITKL